MQYIVVTLKLEVGDRFKSYLSVNEIWLRYPLQKGETVSGEWQEGICHFMETSADDDNEKFRKVKSQGRKGRSEQEKDEKSLTYIQLVLSASNIYVFFEFKAVM